MIKFKKNIENLVHDSFISIPVSRYREVEVYRIYDKLVLFLVYLNSGETTFENIFEFSEVGIEGLINYCKDEL